MINTNVQSVVWGEGVKTRLTLFKIIKNYDLFLKCELAAPCKNALVAPHSVKSRTCQTLQHSAEVRILVMY
jgi:hypothetical protein